MIRKLIRASLGKNRLVSALLATFLILSSALLSGAIMLGFGLFGTVDSFMESASTPHYMQMHTGTLNRERMQSFVDGQPNVVAWEPIEFLNVENSQLRFNGESLDTEIQQNGFVKQSSSMDFLLSESGDVIHPRQGEIWVPFFYEDKYHLEPGDQITLQTPNGEMVFTVAGSFRDSQMNSTLASSKRLLISDTDFATMLQATGTDPEYLISFRLRSPGDASALEAAYFNAELEANGPSLTWTMFRLINSINDALTAILFMFMSGIILLIACLCIRYTLLTTIEEDLKDVGTMRALGISNKQVQSIYVGKYQLLLGLGCLVGFILSLVARGPLLAGVQRQMGTVNYPIVGVLAGFFAVVLLFLVAMAYVRRVLKKLRSISPLQALQGASGLVASRRRPRHIIRGHAGGSVNARVALANIRRSRSQHLTIMVMAALITLVLLVPFRFGATFQSPDFVTYMGIGEYDLLIDLHNSADAKPTADRIVAELQNDTRVSTFQAYTIEVETTVNTNGETAPLRIDYGDPTSFPLRYSSGKAPVTQTELGLSEQNAERLDVGIGDEVVVESDSGDVSFIVSGIYQDVTNGGKTAKALPGPTMDAANPSVMIAIDVAEGASTAEVIEAIHQVAPDVSVIDTQTFVSQMMGGMIDVMNTVAWVFAVVAVVISALIAGLSIRLMQVQELKANAIQGALGVTTRMLRNQYLVRIMVMVVIGVVIGVALATPLGNLMGNAIFSTVGVSGASLVFSPATTLLGCALVVISAALVTWSNTGPTFNAGIVDRLRA